MQHSEPFLKMVKKVKEKIQEIDCLSVQKKIENKEPIILIDVREDSEWALGHIKGAIHLSKGILERDIVSVCPNFNSEIILYCGGGYRSALSADSLQKMGYLHVFSLQGGVRAWLELNLPLLR